MNEVDNMFSDCILIVKLPLTTPSHGEICSALSFDRIVIWTPSEPPVPMNEKVRNIYLLLTHLVPDERNAWGVNSCVHCPDMSRSNDTWTRIIWLPASLIYQLSYSTINSYACWKMREILLSFYFTLLWTSQSSLDRMNGGFVIK